MYIGVRIGGKKYSFFGKYDITCYLRFNIRPFALLPTRLTIGHFRYDD